jgi:hypothetical protein
MTGSDATAGWVAHLLTATFLASSPAFDPPLAARLETAAAPQPDQPEQGGGCADHQAISIRSRSLSRSTRAVVRVRRLEHRAVPASADGIRTLG